LPVTIVYVHTQINIARATDKHVSAHIVRVALALALPVTMAARQKDASTKAASIHAAAEPCPHILVGAKRECGAGAGLPQRRHHAAIPAAPTPTEEGYVRGTANKTGTDNT
jgi:hypothetical protein